MKRVLIVISTFVIAAVAVHAQAPAGQGQTIGLSTSLQRAYATFKQNFTQSAEKMPEADYSFKPGSTPEARPFSAVIAHIVQNDLLPRDWLAEHSVGLDAIVERFKDIDVDAYAAFAGLKPVDVKKAADAVKEQA